MRLVRLHWELEKLSPGLAGVVVTRYSGRFYYGSVLKLLAIVLRQGAWPSHAAGMVERVLSAGRWRSGKGRLWTFGALGMEKQKAAIGN